MKIIEKYNYLFLFIFLVIQYIKQNLCNEYEVIDVYPLNIKIENTGEQYTYLTLTFNHNFTEEEKINQYLRLQKNESNNIICPASSNISQDEFNQNKIIFQLDKNKFLNKIISYGRYAIDGINNSKDIQKNIKYDKISIWTMAKKLTTKHTSMTPKIISI